MLPVHVSRSVEDVCVNHSPGDATMKILQACFSRCPVASELIDLATLKPQLVLVFGSVALISDPQVLQALLSAFPDAELAGCSTAGEIADEGVLDDHLVLTALHFKDPGFRGATTDLQCVP
jgi:hypothetical protein